MKIAFLSMDPKGAVIRGAGYVAASIPTSNDVNFYCCSNKYKKNNYSGLVKIISENKTDIVMISTTTLLYNDASQVINAIKTSNDIPILIGGVHPMVVGPDLLKENLQLDYLCIGEGETFIKEFVAKYGTEELFDINNLAYRRDGKIFSNPLNPPEDLSKLPMFPYKYFDRVVTPSSPSALPLSATRGCPHACTYCCNSTFLRMYGKSYIRQMPIKNVLRELKYLKANYKFVNFHFGDDTILADYEYAAELLNLLKSEVNVSYTCMSRAESINEKVILLLKKTGCSSIGMGVECGDEAFRKKYLRRFMSNDQIKNAFVLLRKAGIRCSSFNMIGWPFDYDDKLTKATADFNKEIDPDGVQVTWFYPFPGTKLYDYCKKHDLINKELTLRSYHRGSVLKGYENKKSFFKSYRRK